MEQQLNRMLLTISLIIIYYLLIDQFVWLYLPLDTPTAQLLGNLIAIIAILTLAIITAYYISNRLNRRTKRRLNTAILTVVFSVVYFVGFEKYVWLHLPMETSIGVFVWSMIVLTMTVLLGIVSAHYVTHTIRQKSIKRN